MKPIISAALVACLPTVAVSQTCTPTDIVDAYNAAADSDRQYFVLSGVFDLPASEATREPRSIGAGFKGKLLTGEGFTDEVSVPVTLDLGCDADGNCAQIKPDLAYITFMERQDDKLVLDVDICYQQVFETPSGEDILRIEACAQGESCE